MIQQIDAVDDADEMPLLFGVVHRKNYLDSHIHFLLSSKMGWDMQIEYFLTAAVRKFSNNPEPRK
jgi:hypothetical protein